MDTTTVNFAIDKISVAAEKLYSKAISVFGEEIKAKTLVTEFESGDILKIL